MCGACGSAPAHHWSAPFLATLPARSSAARAVTAIVAQAGARVGVAAVAGGYSVTTPTGQCVVAADLDEVWTRLRRLRIVDDAVPPAPTTVVSAGPATVPRVGPPTPVAGGRPAGVDPFPRRLHRLPALLAWLAAVDGRGPRLLRLRLGLVPEVDAAIDVVAGSVVRCAAVPAHGALDVPVELDDPDGVFAEPVRVLVEPWTAVSAPLRTAP
jgi:hypothetical protein